MAPNNLSPTSTPSDPIEALRESEERYRRLVELSPEAILVHDGQHIIYSNPGSAVLLGVNNPDALLGYPILKLVHPDDQEVVKARMRSVAQAQEAERTELRFVRLDGGLIEVEAVATPIMYGGEPAVMSIIRDITEQKCIAANLARQVQELSRSNEELEQIAYVASHDLQEPLRKVVSFSDLLAHSLDGQLNSETETYMAQIANGAMQMQALVRDLLAYVQVGKTVPTLAFVDASESLEAALGELKTAIREQQAEITYDPLPEVLSQLPALRQLWHQLLTNALKYRAVDPPRIHITAQFQEAEWQFSVRDNGMGFEPEYAKQIFAIFKRLHARGSYPGTGVGLAICQKIVTRHGGQMWAESEPGYGSTFYFTLPAATLYPLPSEA